MGFFGLLKEAAIEANDIAHGERLDHELTSTIECIKRLDGRVANMALVGFVRSKIRLLNQIQNWSREGRIKTGRDLQAEARKCFDLDQAKSYGLWLAGAWLESMERSSPKAISVHSMLEAFSREIEKDLAEML